MKTRGAIFRLWLALPAAVAVALPAQAIPLSPAEYRGQLRELNLRVEQLKQYPEKANQLETELPDVLSVNDGAREYKLNYDWLKNLLKQFQQADSKTRSVFLVQIQDRLKDLDAEAQAYDNAEQSSANQEKLRQILARREFRKAHGPTWWDIMKDKIERWLAGIFSRRWLGRGATDVLQVLVYAAVAIAFIMFAIWLKRRFASPPEEVSREIIPFAPSAKNWTAWLGEARASAQRGDWRNAVHLAYWAGISFLEANGAWKPDRARTPREYLRILGTRKPQYPTLSALTRKFEVIWYGNRDAQAADFSDALQQLEKLGCK